MTLLVLLASCGSSAAQSAGSISRSSSAVHTAATACGPAGATTLADNGRVRVYALHQVVYGCSAARGRSFRLGHATHVIAEARVGPVAVAGDLAAYGLSSFGVDTVRASVVVRRLTDGTQLKQLAATKAVGAESFQSVGSVVLRPDGAVAWIGTEHSIIAHRGATEVHEADAGGDHVIDSGSGIDAASLRLHGTALTWANGAVTHHATLG